MECDNIRRSARKKFTFDYVAAASGKNQGEDDLSDEEEEEDDEEDDDFERSLTSAQRISTKVQEEVTEEVKPKRKYVKTNIKEPKPVPERVYVRGPYKKKNKPNSSAVFVQPQVTSPKEQQKRIDIITESDAELSLDAPPLLLQQEAYLMQQSISGTKRSEEHTKDFGIRQSNRQRKPTAKLAETAQEVVPFMVYKNSPSPSPPPMLEVQQPTSSETCSVVKGPALKRKYNKTIDDDMDFGHSRPCSSRSLASTSSDQTETGTRRSNRTVKPSLKKLESSQFQIEMEPLLLEIPTPSGSSSLPTSSLHSYVTKPCHSISRSSVDSVDDTIEAMKRRMTLMMDQNFDERFAKFLIPKKAQCTSPSSEQPSTSSYKLPRNLQQFEKMPVGTFLKNRGVSSIFNTSSTCGAPTIDKMVPAELPSPVVLSEDNNIFEVKDVNAENDQSASSSKLGASNADSVVLAGKIQLSVLLSKYENTKETDNLNVQSLISSGISETADMETEETFETIDNDEQCPVLERETFIIGEKDSAKIILPDEAVPRIVEEMSIKTVLEPEVTMEVTDDVFSMEQEDYVNDIEMTNYDMIKSELNGPDNKPPCQISTSTAEAELPMQAMEDFHLSLKEDVDIKEESPSPKDNVADRHEISIEKTLEESRKESSFGNSENGEDSAVKDEQVKKTKNENSQCSTGTNDKMSTTQKESTPAAPISSAVPPQEVTEEKKGQECVPLRHSSRIQKLNQKPSYFQEKIVSNQPPGSSSIPSSNSSQDNENTEKFASNIDVLYFQMRKVLGRGFPERNYRCLECSFKTSDCDAMQLHTYYHKSSKLEDRNFQCSECTFNVNSASCMTQHLRIHNIDVTDDNVVKAYAKHVRQQKIEEGRARMALLNRLNAAIKRPIKEPVREKNKLPMSSKAKAAHRSKQFSSTVEFRCDKCDFKCASVNNSFEHSDRHGWNKLYRCKLCDYSDDTKEVVGFHETKHHNIDHLTLANVVRNISCNMRNGFIQPSLNGNQTPTSYKIAQRSGGALIKCSFCEYHTHVASEMGLHMQNNHRKETGAKEVISDLYMGIMPKNSTIISVSTTY